MSANVESEAQGGSIATGMKRLAGSNDYNKRVFVDQTSVGQRLITINPFTADPVKALHFAILV